MCAQQSSSPQVCKGTSGPWCSTHRGSLHLIYCQRSFRFYYSPYLIRIKGLLRGRPNVVMLKHRVKMAPGSAIIRKMTINQVHFASDGFYKGNRNWHVTNGDLSYLYLPSLKSFISVIRHLCWQECLCSSKALDMRVCSPHNVRSFTTPLCS